MIYAIILLYLLLGLIVGLFAYGLLSGDIKYWIDKKRGDLVRHIGDNSENESNQSN